MKRLFVLALVAAFALTLVPAASAQDSGYLVFADGTWLADCGEAPGNGGVVGITVNAYAPTGSTGEGFYADYWPNWDPAYWENSWTWAGFFKVIDQAWVYWVPDGGFVTEAHDLYAEGGGYIATIEFYAE
ncbi:MAG: hypothetical protein JXJ20_13485, partial [Anaerolineae bacterium]|nr:hypothetical protein [Anaerolineae bacterium]